MARALLIRGMLVGVLAALLAVLFARLVAEPQVDLAITFEAARDHMAGMAEEPELVSRATQKGTGLLTAVGLYGAATGGIFSLVFAALYGRWSRLGPRSTALLLSAAAFIAIALVPALKYPPNPPAVGLHETVGLRTATYFGMIGLSLLALVIAVRLGGGLAPRLGAFNAALAAGGCYVALITLVQAVLPSINEVPADFPAVLLWNFRIASLAMQAILWGAIGIAFGIAAERTLRSAA